jgi:hypothetical protein
MAPYPVGLPGAAAAVARGRGGRWWPPSLVPDRVRLWPTWLLPPPLCAALCAYQAGHTGDASKKKHSLGLLALGTARGAVVVWDMRKGEVLTTLVRCPRPLARWSPALTCASHSYTPSGKLLCVWGCVRAAACPGWLPLQQVRFACVDPCRPRAATRPP